MRSRNASCGWLVFGWVLFAAGCSAVDDSEVAGPPPVGAGAAGAGSNGSSGGMGGGINLGSGGSGGAGQDSESCGDGLDDDGDGLVDEGCGCSAGSEQACYDGPVELAGVGACTMGVQSCTNGEELASWGTCTGAGQPSAEQCNNAIDDDCDGEVDEDCENCNQEIQLTLSGDCVTSSCPPEAPYPVGCNINFIGDTPVGCVAHSPDSPVVFFKEGVVCDAGYLTGTLKCSCAPGPPLDAGNCPINKQNTYYPASQTQCP